ncbi:MAG: integrating conjugative element protein (TIGR03759 family) [Francisellaceae bacterium]|jgi:integrating conjugative element protein (TIGR03759 family)
MKHKQKILAVLLTTALVSAHAAGSHPWASSASANNTSAKVENATTGTPNTESINFSNMSVSSFSELSEKKQKALAKQWNMSTAKFQEYLDVRANSATGFLYGDVKQDPNVLMAIYQLSQGDKAQAYEYMETAAQNEHAAAEQLIEAQNMFQKMIQRLYPNETPIQLAGQRPASYVSYDNPFSNLASKYAGIITNNTTYVLLINANETMNMSLDSQISGLINQLLKKQNVRLDIYDISGASSEKIIAWAKAMRINSALVNGGFITINQGGLFVAQLVARLKHKVTDGSLYKDDHGNYISLDLSKV